VDVCGSLRVGGTHDLSIVTDPALAKPVVGGVTPQLSRLIEPLRLNAALVTNPPRPLVGLAGRPLLVVPLSGTAELCVDDETTLFTSSWSSPSSSSSEWCDSCRKGFGSSLTTLSNGVEGVLLWLDAVGVLSRVNEERPLLPILIGVPSERRGVTGLVGSGVAAF